MTDQEKKNLANVLRLAKGYIAEAKKDAVAHGDIDTSIRIANNEALIEQRFLEQGIELP